MQLKMVFKANEFFVFEFTARIGCTTLTERQQTDIEMINEK